MKLGSANQIEKDLLEVAKGVMENAYAPYSKFKVGAALLGESGKVYTGCNVENASFGATVCAEQIAVFKAVSEGENSFKAIAIVSSSNQFTYPCGICRQVLGEFMPEGQVILQNQEGEIKTYLFEALLPHHFGKRELDK